MSDKAPNGKKKMAVGWFSFTCCEDSTVLFTELLNENYDEWRKLVNFQHVKALKTDNKLEGLDVAFVEGAISAPSQEKELKEIRANAKYLVAIGSCASTGLPSASRNEFSEDDKTDRIRWYFETFDYGEKVKRLDEVVKVDDYVKGCPMNVDVFLGVLTKYLQKFGLVDKDVTS